MKISSNLCGDNKYNQAMWGFWLLLCMLCRAGVVQRITESGLTLNKFCYAALIAAEKNQLVKRSDVFDKVIILKLHETLDCW